MSANSSLDTASVRAGMEGDGRALDFAAAMHYGVVPLKRVEGQRAAVASTSAADMDTYVKVRFLLRSDPRWVMVSADEFDALVRATWTEEQRRSDMHYGAIASYKARIVSDGSGGKSGEVTKFDLDGSHKGMPVVELVDDIFSRAITIGASDIHLEPGEDGLGVRFRLDGVLQPVLVVERAQQGELLSRIKILAQMDIAERRRPQDGRIVVGGAHKTVDMRVSSMPTPHGEKIVLRLLDKSMQPLELAALGLEGRNRALFGEAIRKPNGMILVTGPTGSGKTTTLYAALKEILSPRINISTVEDPIEYQMAGINQTQMHAAIGYTFANAVRTFLRQDPDVIMIGEIRDPETAKYAIQAAQTGHLVFSTLHTNDAPSAIVRLLEMGMEPYLVASTVHLIMAQRLVRKVCGACGSVRSATAAEREFLGMRGAGEVALRQGTGCKACARTGYRGRIGIFEMMPVTPGIQELVTNKASTPKIRDLAVTEGMATLRAAAVERVLSGACTVEEIRAVVG